MSPSTRATRPQPIRAVWIMRCLSIVAVVVAAIAIATSNTDPATYGQIAVAAAVVVFITAMLPDQHVVSRLLLYAGAAVLVLVTGGYHWVTLIALALVIVASIVKPQPSKAPAPPHPIITGVIGVSIVSLIGTIGFSFLWVDVILLIAAVWVIWTLCAYTWPTPAGLALNFAVLVWVSTWIVAIDIVINSIDAIFIQALTVPLGSIAALATLIPLYRDTRGRPRKRTLR